MTASPITAEPDGRSWSLRLPSGTILENCDSALRTDEEELLPDRIEVAPSGELTCRFANGAELRISVSEMDGTGLMVTSRLTNASAAPIHPGLVVLFRTASFSGATAFDRILVTGRDMNGCSGLLEAAESMCSSCVAGLTESSGGKALVAGFTDLRREFCDIGLTCSGGRVRGLSANCDRENTVLNPGEELHLPSLLLLEGKSLSALMEHYASLSGEAMNARAQGELETGWCSWYHYYGTESVEDIRENIRALKQSEIAGELKTIQIDDGWNFTAPDAPRNWGDWTPGYKFPDGMKAIADEIRAAGFRPGLWLAPFAVDPASRLFSENPEWLLKDTDGLPKPFWGVYGLDLTNPAALDFVRETFTRVFDVWGFEYIKIDFLLFAAQPAVRHNDSMTGAAALRAGLEVIRDVAGERFVLGCGCPIGPAVGLCDGMRIGLDVSHRWYLPMNLENWPWGNCNIYAGAKHVLWRQWMHRQWWQNDPDCLLTDSDGSKGEKRMFTKEFDGVFANEPGWGLTDEEAAFWLRMVWMSGGMIMLGENLAALPSDRRELLEKAFPPHGGAPRLADWYGDPDTGVMILEKPRKIIGLFNLSDEPRAVTLSEQQAGIPLAGQYREWLTGETLEIGDSPTDFPELAGRSARLWVAQ